MNEALGVEIGKKQQFAANQYFETHPQNERKITTVDKVKIFIIFFVFHARKCKEIAALIMEILG